jgi:type IV secretion system protein VirD4
VSEAATRTELMPMALLRQVRPGEALLLHNTLPPAHLFGRYWFRDPTLHEAATGQPPPRRPSRARQLAAALGLRRDPDQPDDTNPRGNAPNDESPRPAGGDDHDRPGPEAAPAEEVA